MKWRLVYLESPFAGDVDRNLHYARICMADCLARGDAPFVSHALYTQPHVLDDDIPEERTRGMSAGFAWADVAEVSVFYTDLGISKGMQQGIEHAERAGRTIEYRTLGTDWRIE